MGLLAWVRKIIGGKVTAEVEEAAFLSAATEVCVRELAFQSAVNIIAKAVAKCEFRTYDRGKEIKGAEYYLWNVRPNKNQNSSTFLSKWVYQLHRHNEALIIEENGELYVADSFRVEEFALRDYVFTGVTVDNFTFGKAFYMSDVMYCKLNSKDVNQTLGLLYGSYGKLLACGMKAYQRGRGIRGILKISAAARSNTKFEETYQRITGTDLKAFMQSDYAVLPQYDGFEYEELGSKTYAAENSRDVRAMVDDVFDFTARAFCIPPALLRGEIAETSQAVDNLLTFCVDPLLSMLEEEANGKRNGEKGFLEGTCLDIDTRAIRHVDLLNAASGIEKLVSSGTFCVNEVRAILGRATIDEPWAWQHFVTKNYSDIEAYLKDAKGGERD